jgi:hypothetical protein
MTSKAFGLAQLGNAFDDGALSNRNKIINGAMVIDQRNAGASVTANDGTFAVDRFRFSMTQSSTGTGQRSSTAPAGFNNSLLFTSSAATSVGAADQFAIVHPIEGFNIADLGWGTAAAQTVTLSFWVRSSLTGTFGGALQNQAANRSYPFTYTINSADTFEFKTIAVAGDTTGTWNTDNSGGLRIFIGLGMGSNSSGTAGAWAAANYQSATGAVSVVATNEATFYITGVQLEAGDTATPFEHRSFGQELALCQRYYYKIAPGAATRFLTGAGAASGATDASGMTGFFPVTMRTRPTALEQSGTAGDYSIGVPGLVNETANTVPVFSAFTTDYQFSVECTAASGLTAYAPVLLRTVNANAFLAWSAEL